MSEMKENRLTRRRLEGTGHSGYTKMISILSRHLECGEPKRIIITGLTNKKSLDYSKLNNLKDIERECSK